MASWEHLPDHHLRRRACQRTGQNAGQPFLLTAFDDFRLIQQPPIPNSPALSTTAFSGYPF
jgi:hypothetical protein